MHNQAQCYMNLQIIIYLYIWHVLLPELNIFIKYLQKLSYKLPIIYNKKLLKFI